MSETRRRKYLRMYRGISANNLISLPLVPLKFQNNKGRRISHSTENMGRLNNLKSRSNLVLYMVLFKSTRHKMNSPWKKTGYLFKVISNRGYIDKNHRRNTRGTKNMKYKYHVTLYICTNDFSCKIQLFIIRKYKNPTYVINLK